MYRVYVKKATDVSKEFASSFFRFDHFDTILYPKDYGESQYSLVG